MTLMVTRVDASEVVASGIDLLENEIPIIDLKFLNRDFEAELTDTLTVLVREVGGENTEYTIGEAFEALLPMRVEDVLRTTADYAIRQLLRKHADRVTKI